MFHHDTCYISGGITYVPVDASGNVIPHIFCHALADGVSWGDSTVEPICEFDVYECEETAEEVVNPWSWKMGQVVTPDWFAPWKGEPTIVGEFTYMACDAGCHGCGYEYPHVDWDFRIVSGLFLVPKGFKVASLDRRESGASCFPDFFTLKMKD